MIYNVSSLAGADGGEDRIDQEGVYKWGRSFRTKVKT